jgi:hypothetical protein
LIQSRQCSTEIDRLVVGCAIKYVDFLSSIAFAELQSACRRLYGRKQRIPGPLEFATTVFENTLRQSIPEPIGVSVDRHLIMTPAHILPAAALRGQLIELVYSRDVYTFGVSERYLKVGRIRTVSPARHRDRVFG